MGAFEVLQQLEAHVGKLTPSFDVHLDLQNRLLLIGTKDSQKHPDVQDKTMESMLKIIVPRLALCHDAGILLLNVSLNLNTKSVKREKQEISSRIFKTIIQSAIHQFKQFDWHAIGIKGTTFAVKIQRIGEGSPNFFDRTLTNRLAKDVGGIIHDNFAGEKKVDLSSPELVFHGILSTTHFYLYLVIAHSARKSLNLRNPKERPYSNPSILDPFLLRSMINIARVKRGSVILDPFCGTGSTFIEAADLGVLAIGIELSRLVSWGALQNLQGLSLPAHLILSDARLMPLATDSVDAIVFDPPYGRGASTLGTKITDLLREALIQAERVLRRDGFLVMSLIDKVKLEDFYPSSSNLRLVKIFEWYVHRSMTRKIYIFENKK